MDVSKEGLGRILSNIGNINCGSYCSSSYSINSSVTLTATPEPGYSFTGWAGDCTGISSCVLTMTGKKNVIAKFIANSEDIFKINVTKTGSGKVTSFPNGIDCGTRCELIYGKGATITLYATPEPGSTFLGWGGDCAGNDYCTILLNQDKNVSASFSNSGGASPNIIITKEGSGKVVSSPLGIDCGVTCTSTFPLGTLIYLTAIPESGSRFIGWSGDCVGTDNCSINLNIDKNVKANFEKISNDSKYGIGGNISGLFRGNVIVLRLNQEEDFLARENGTYQFGNKLPTGSKYTVTVSAYPANQECKLTNPTGTIGTSIVGNIDVICETHDFVYDGLFKPFDSRYWNKIKAGTKAIIRWRVKDKDGGLVTDTGLLKKASYRQIDCLSGSYIDGSDEIILNPVAVNWSKTRKWFQTNWKTPKLNQTCLQLDLFFVDNQAISTKFILK